MKKRRHWICSTVMIAVGVLFSASVPAALLSYAFGGEFQDGLLVGAPGYAGSVQFDDSALTGVGEESISVTGLNFSFLGRDFDQRDAGATVWFSQRVFQGLSFVVTTFDPAFTLAPGAIDVNDAYLAYDLAGQGSGFGSVSYATVPAPMTFWLLLSALGILVVNLRQRLRTSS